RAAGVQPRPGAPVDERASDRPPPEGSATAAPSGSDASPERRARVEMDRATGPEPPGKRTYHEPFNPAVFPFKRMTALDAVLPDESLVLAERSTARQRLRVLGADRRESARDAFWGSIVIDFEPGKWVPLPSVAADARVLAARVEPEIEVTFAHDGGDNQYVMSTTGGRHRLVWLTDAPQRYFAGDIPAGYVENELHVFVEVFVPHGVGWRRINLGGALVDQEVSGADGKVPYRPKGDDPFPQPPAFANGNDAQPTQPKGLKPPGASSSSAGAGSGGGSSGGGTS